MAKTSPWMGELDFRYNERSVLGVHACAVLPGNDVGQVLLHAK